MVLLFSYVYREISEEGQLQDTSVANVVQKSARKAFNIKYNPDQHWSCALYTYLDVLQLTDGRNIMNLGRDDQAGFRLDTTATHRQHGTLCVRGAESLTTRTDYTTKYASTLQTTCYNFPPTGTTGELCAGVVKAPVLFEKNSAQHFSDIKMIQNHDEMKPAFLNPDTGEKKKKNKLNVLELMEVAMKVLHI